MGLHDTSIALCLSGVNIERLRLAGKSTQLHLKER